MSDNNEEKYTSGHTKLIFQLWSSYMTGVVTLGFNEYPLYNSSMYVSGSVSRIPFTVSIRMKQTNLLSFNGLSQTNLPFSTASDTYADSIFSHFSTSDKTSLCIDCML